MSRNLGLAALPLALAASPAMAQTPPPRLIVVISVDQFGSDLFAQYRPLFTAGLRRLGSGAVFPSGYQSHAATETCPGHATMLTGAHPSRAGIIANNWYDLSIARPDKKVYCAEDPGVAGSTSINYTVSAQYLRVPTLGDRLKAANPASRVVAVAGKDRAAVMMGGHAIDQAWFWGGAAFVTLPGATAPVPAAVAGVNARAAAAIAVPAGTAPPAQCRSRARAVAVGDRTVGTPAKPVPGDARGFRVALDFDRLTADLAIGLVRELGLGRRGAPDVLAIGLSATDYVGHAFGTEGAEMCAQLLGLDANVGRILDALDATRVPYVVALTADHGGHDLPERNRQRGFAAEARVDAALGPSAMAAALAAEFALAGPVLFGDAAFGDIYLAREVPAGIRARVLEAARARYVAHPQVAAVFTHAELRRMPAPRGSPEEWSLAERFRASFDPERSGDLMVALKPNVTPIAEPQGGFVATHGSPWDFDRRVPILFYRPGAPGFEQSLPVEVVDIVPTLAAMVALPVDAREIDGRCLDLDPGAGDMCPAR